MRWTWIAMALASCGETQKPTYQGRQASAAETFLANIPGALTAPVGVGGLPAGEAACRAFATPQQVAAGQLPQLAACLQALHMAPSHRVAALDDEAVLEASGGYELEARFAGGALVWIGFEPTGGGIPGGATLTPAALERLRASPAAPMTAASDKREVAILEVCLDPDGKAAVVLRAASSVKAGVSMLEQARAWTFKPFAVGGEPTPACAIVGQQTRPSDKPDDDDLANAVPVLPPQSLRSEVFVPDSALGPRVAGLTQIVPDDATKTDIAKKGMQATAVLAFCVDDTGKVGRIGLVRPSGFPRYDAMLTAGISGWKYAPYREDGASARPCALVTFHYNQR